MMMQAFIAPASFFLGAQFFGKGKLASFIQDVHIPQEYRLHFIVSRLLVLRIVHIGPATEIRFDTSVGVISREGTQSG